MRWWNAPEGSPAADRLEVLTLLIEAYEREHYPITDFDPIDFLLDVMEARELSRKGLERFIGLRARFGSAESRVPAYARHDPPARGGTEYPRRRPRSRLKAETGGLRVCDQPGLTATRMRSRLSLGGRYCNFARLSLLPKSRSTRA